MKGKNKCERKRECQEKCKELHPAKIILINGPKFAEIITTTTAKVQYRGAFFFEKVLHTARKLYLTQGLPWKYR